MQYSARTTSPQLNSGEFTTGFWSVSRKLTALVVILFSIGFAIFVIFAAGLLKSNLLDMASRNYAAMSEHIASTVAGAIRWNKAQQARETFDKITKDGDSALYAMSVQGEPDNPKRINALFSTSDSVDAELIAEIELARADVKDQSVVSRVDNHMIIATPVFLNPDTPRIGVLISAWDTSNITELVANKTLYFYVVGTVFELVLAVLLSIVITLSVGRRIKAGVDVARQIAQGNLKNKIIVSSCDELGELEHSLGEVQSSLLANDDSERRAQQFGRIKQALDCARVSTLIADANNEIVFANCAFLDLLSNNPIIVRTADDRTPFSGDLVGKSLNDFTPECQVSGADVANVKTSEAHTFSNDKLTLKINVTPVIGDDKSRLGTVIEWVDRTKEVNAELEVQAMVDAAANGDFSRRIDTRGMTGFYAQVANMLNDLAEISESGLNGALNVLKALAAGQLNSRLEGNQKGVFAELRDNCNITSAKLTDVVDEIRTTGLSINRGAREIAKGNSDLSSRTVEQASQLHETNATMSVMTELVLKNAMHSKHAKELAKSATSYAQQGGEVVGQAVLAMSEINDSSREISDIIGVIDDIAFQTNLLALNASVEAARAGEQGRGFAVVASEVRNLAGRSATAAKEIKELIEDSVGRVSNGAELVNQSGKTLEKIVSEVNKVTEMVSEISEACQEQSDGIGRVRNAIGVLDEGTQQNAVLVEAASVASKSAIDRTGSLIHLIEYFSISPSPTSVQQETRLSVVK